MSDLAMIDRPLTEAEKREFVDIRQLSPKQAFRRQLAKVKFEHDRKHKPFCERCAMFDFQDYLANTLRETVRRQKVTNVTEALNSSTIEMPDFNKYGAEDRFDLLRKEAQFETVKANLTVIREQTGWRYEYQCKIRQCGHSVFVPLEKYEEKTAVKK